MHFKYRPFLYHVSKRTFSTIYPDVGWVGHKYFYYPDLIVVIGFKVVGSRSKFGLLLT